MITLEQIKELPLNEKAFNYIKERRCSPDAEILDLVLGDITGWENQNPYPNDVILELARALYETYLYPDSIWNDNFIPEINEAIEFNNSFVRWYPGYLVKGIEDNNYAIVAYDYSFVNGGRDYTSFMAYFIDGNGNIITSTAWEDYNDYELVDTEHVKENLIKIAEYEMGIKRY